ncbi:cation transporter [Oerskovia turbata]
MSPTAASPAPLPPTSTRLAPERRALLERRVRWIVAATITYNVIEAVIAITAGRIASSAALVGFGLDSVVEVLSAAAVAWQFAAPDPRRRERAAMRLIAISFFGLALFVSVDALRALLGAAEPDHSTVGIALAALSLAIMPALSWFERRTGRELGSASAVADSRQTLLCAYLSAVLLVGLVLNTTLGWAWADPIAALVIAAVAVKEGVEAWRGDACCAPGAALRHAEDAPSSDTAEPGTAERGTAEPGETKPGATATPGAHACSCGDD